MNKKVHVKKGDTVFVLTGKDSGKKGKVLSVDTDKHRVIVEGVNMSVKHRKPRSRNQQGGIIHQESSIDSSNVMLVCSRCGEPSRIARKFLENGQKVRMCKKCNEIIDIIKEPKD